MPLYDIKVAFKDSNFQALKRALRNIDTEPELAAAFVTWQNIYRAFLRRRFVEYSRGGGDWKPLSAATIQARRRGKIKKKPRKKKPAKKKAARKKAKKATRKPKLTFKRLVKSAKKKVKSTRRAVKRSSALAVKKYKAVKRKRAANAREKKARQKIAHSILRDTGAMFATFQPEIVKPTGILNPKDKLQMVVRFGGRGSHPKSRVTLDDLMYYHHTGAGRLPARKLIVGPDQATARRMAKGMESAMQKVLKRKATGNAVGSGAK